MKISEIFMAALRLDRDLHAGREAQVAVGHDALTGGDALLDEGPLLLRAAHDDGAHGDGLVGAMT